VAFDELGIYRLLLLVPDLVEVQKFAHDVLGPLADRDAGGSSQYRDTLAAYFRENASYQAAARSLHVHPNTIVYRLRRVESITGLDLSDSHHRLLLQLALEILATLGPEHE